jgi:hypothetical protein
MRTNYFLLISCFLFLLSCGEKKITSGNNNTSNENTSKKEEDIRTEVDSPIVDSVKIKNARKKREEERKKADQIFHGIKCNYKGTIGDIPIRAYLDWQESYHSPGTGAIQLPFIGYYFFESSKIKIPIEGDMNGVMMFYMNTTKRKNKESFSGRSEYGTITGTWECGTKSLPFTLKEI